MKISYLDVKEKKNVHLATKEFRWGHHFISETEPAQFILGLHTLLYSEEVPIH